MKDEVYWNRSQDPKYIDSTTRVTRRAEATILRVPVPRTNKLKKAPIYNGSTLWNNLPVKVRKSGSPLELKNLLRRHREGRPLDWRVEAAQAQQQNINTD